MPVEQPVISKGLEGVTAAATQIAEVDGQNGKLTLRGYDIGELSGKVTFEEVAYLLWDGALPTHAEYDDLRAEMSRARSLPAPVLAALADLAPHAEGMHMLRMGAAMLSIGDADVDSLDLAGAKRRAASEGEGHVPHPAHFPASLALSAVAMAVTVGQG